MGKHRSRLGIIAGILSIVNANNGAKKTHIMYKAYLSYDLLTRYMNDLLKSDLIIPDENNNYSLSKRGKEFLVKFNEYSQLVKDINEKVNHIKDQRLTLENMCPVEKLL